MKRLGLVVLASFLASCASTKPLTVVCAGCSLLQASGACATAALRLRPCEGGKNLYLLNFKDAFDHGADPVVECR